MRPSTAHRARVESGSRTRRAQAPQPLGPRRGERAQRTMTVSTSPATASSSSAVKGGASRPATCDLLRIPAAGQGRLAQRLRRGRGGPLRSCTPAPRRLQTSSRQASTTPGRGSSRYSRQQPRPRCVALNSAHPHNRRSRYYRPSSPLSLRFAAVAASFQNNFHRSIVLTDK